LKALVLLAVTLLFAAPALAKDVTYVCTLHVANSQQWVPSQVAILHKTGNEAGTENVLVNDPLIMHFVKKPVTGKVAANNAQRITFTWELPHIRNAGGQQTPRFLYRASYFKKTGKVNIAATPAGYPDNFNATGKCALR